MKILMGLLFLSLNVTLAADQTADKVLAQFLKIPKPDNKSSEFQHWTYNMAGMDAIYCWSILNKNTPFPEALKKFRSTKALTHASASESQTLPFCQSIAEKGFQPVCTHSVPLSKDLKNRRTDLPLDYLQVPKNKPLSIEGTIGCYANDTQLQKQTYVGPLTAVWAVKPTMQSIMTPSGAKMLEVGTVIVTAPGTKGLDGKEYSEPKLTVVISE